MSKTTDGPWKITANKRQLFVVSVNEKHLDLDGDGADICSLSNRTYYGADEFAANARLIAAAPDLLEALKAIDADWVWFWGSGPDALNVSDRACYPSEPTLSLWRKVRAAIAKAEGSD